VILDLPRDTNSHRSGPIIPISGRLLVRWADKGEIGSVSQAARNNKYTFAGI
jgi:hypothetical protein